MRDISGFKGAVYSTTELIMRFSIINILWFVINLPISILVLSFYFSNSGNGIITFLTPLVLLIPALFIPSTIAMYATVREWILKIEQQSLMKVYLSHLKANYKKSFLSGLVLMFIWLIWIVDFYFFNKVNDLLSIVFLIIGLVLFVYTINFFSLNVHYKMSIRDMLKNAFFVTMGNPILFCFILMGNLLLFYFSVTEFLFLFPLFTGSLSAYLSFSAFHRFSLKIKNKALSNKSS